MSHKPKPVIKRGIYKKQATRYPSIGSIAMHFGCNKETITRHIKNGKPYNNYILTFEGEGENENN